MRKPPALLQQPSAEYEAFRSGSGAMSTLPPPVPSGGGGDETVRSVSPVIQQQQSVPRPLSAGRPASTGFTQYGKSQVWYKGKSNESFVYVFKLENVIYLFREITVREGGVRLLIKTC